MDAADLKVFETVARLGGIGRAAQALNTVQSNVTARVRLLEQELGTPLFERHPRGVTLTAAAAPHPMRPSQDLLARAIRAAWTWHAAGAAGDRHTGTTVAMRLPRIIAAYVSAHPAVDLTLRPASASRWPACWAANSTLHS
jgi:DNA-binding transcriptional LysR family regulator